jgi:aspartyl-tRNA(Asn)/glutamyl-tRNA(Gln) amidotransferase subunit B
MKSSWQPIIGLEVHVELKNKAKMFCSCPSDHFCVKPNTNTCPVCLGLPGALPVPNWQGIEKTIIIAKAFGSKINRSFWFDRKNYFYPDLPKGYQISQQHRPIGIGGKVPIVVDGKLKDILLDNIHLEEDTAKLIHKKEKTLIDYNRSGVALVEIVTQPCLRSAKEAKLYLQRLRQTLRWIGVSDCDMEKGSMRLEANISIARSRKGPIDILPNYKVEVKNLNSFKFVEKSIKYEIGRQIEILKKGKTPKQETRGFDPVEGKTYSQRSKEVAKDYRYFPEPDIPPFRISLKKLSEIKKKISVLPWQIEEKWLKMGIPKDWVAILSAKKTLADLLEQTIKKDKNQVGGKQIAKILVNRPNLRNKNPDQILKVIASEKKQFSLTKGEILIVVKKVLLEQPKAVADLKGGKQQVIGFLVGQVQAKTEGKADPKKIIELIVEQANHS